MHLEVHRRYFTDQSTIGDFFINGVAQCFSLEDRVRAAGIKVPGKTAIPAGTYTVVIDLSSRFGRYMPHLLNVPMFSGIRIHSGNTDKDTEGCILLGEERAINAVFRSRQAYSNFFDKIAMQTGFDESAHTPIYRTREATDITIIDMPETDERTDGDNG